MSTPLPLASCIRQAIVEQLDGKDICSFPTEQEFLDFWNTVVHYDAEDAGVGSDHEEETVRQVYREMVSEANRRPLASMKATHGVQKENTMAPIFGYYINLDERGDFAADVRDEDGKTVYEIKAGASLDSDETSIFDDGFMRNKEDVTGLETYLKDLKVIPSDAEVLSMTDFEQALEARQEAASSPRP